MPSSRSYHQYCGVARGLDLIGERWTLLIVRDLLIGPKRYKDLLEGLPGIGTNLLADRLRDLEAAGMVERAVLPPPAASAVYQLTETGQALEPVVAAIGRWGARFLGQPQPEDRFPISAYPVAMRGIFHPEIAVGLTHVYELRLEHGHVFEIRIDDGLLTTRESQPVSPDTILTMDTRTLLALLREGLPPRQAIAAGRVTLHGSLEDLDRFVALFAKAGPGSEG